MFILIFLLSQAANASQIVYELNGVQSVVSVGAGGAVTSDATVLWDERVDGPLPSGAPVGHADRVGGSLVANAAKLAAKQAREQSKADSDALDAQEKADFQALKVKVRAGTATAAEVRQTLKMLLKRVGE